MTFDGPLDLSPNHVSLKANLGVIFSRIWFVESPDTYWGIRYERNTASLC